MDTIKYEVLLRAVEKGSLSKAALEMDYTQSGISHMMKSLEEEFGFPVLTRGRSGVTLTKDGETILPYIRALVQANSSLQQSISDINGFHQGSITIGSLTSITIGWLLPVMKAFNADYPHIQIRLLDGTSDELYRMLEDGLLDIGFFCTKPHMPFKSYLLYDDPIYAILPPDSKIEPYSRVKLSALKSYRFIITTLGGEYDSLSILHSAGISMECTFFSKDTYAAIEMVESGFGISFVPAAVLRSRQNRVVPVEPDPPLHRQFGMFTPNRTTLSPASRKFLNYCREIIPGLTPKGQA